MNKKNKLILLALLVFLLAAALIFLVVSLRQDETPQGTQPNTPPAPTQVSTQAPDQTPSPTQPQADTQPSVPVSTSQPTASAANPLTGEALEAPLKSRVFLASINNHKEALPQQGISQASIYYEMLVEGSVTRCLGVFTDIASVEKLGAIRSARIYTVGLTQCYDGILCHAGGSDEADSAIVQRDVDHIDAVRSSGGDAYYRDKDRLSSGYSKEHTLFTGADLLLANAQRQGLALEREQPYDFGMTFAQDATPAGGETAESITLAFGKQKSSKTTTMNFNAETGKYEASQFKESWIDGNTGEVLSFENVLVLFAKTYTQKDGVHKTIELVAEGDGLFACNGKIVPIKWSRAGDTQPFVYTLTDGTPLTFGIGTSYIGLVPLGSNVFYG